MQAAAAGTPYVATRTDSGFDVTIDVADATWYALLHQHGIKKAFIHHVALDEVEQTYTVLDDSRVLEWRAGAEVEGGAPRPVLGASLGRRIGTVREISVRKTYAWDERGEYGKVLDFSFRSGEGNDLIDAAAQRLGLTQRLPTVSRVAVGFAVVGGLGALAGLVAVVVLALRGAF